MPAWLCPDCGAPFGSANASHSCVRSLEERFAGADQAVREAFDRLVELATVDGPVPIVAQKTRIVLAALMWFLAVQVGRDRLTGHVLAERPFEHPAVVDIVEDAYGSGLASTAASRSRRHPNLMTCSPDLVRDAAARSVGGSDCAAIR